MVSITITMNQMNTTKLLENVFMNDLPLPRKSSLSGALKSMQSSEMYKR